jgi:hypothetical protein
MNMTPEELAIFGEAPAEREPGSDDGDPTPAVDLEKLKAAEEAHAAVLPPDAPASDDNAPPPIKAKRGRKPKVTLPAGQYEMNGPIQVTGDVDLVGAPTPVHPTDGPGWQTVNCSVCGADLGKRPAGHQIDPSQCPNQEVHRALAEPTVERAKAQIPDSFRRIARALRAAADALES